MPFVSYAPQSGQVFGVLKQMKETFEANLPEIQREEMAKIAKFAELKGAKESEIKSMEESVETKTEELAGAKEALATAKNDLEDTKASLSADQKFLLELTNTCIEGDSEWEKRRKMRTDEISAVSQAIAVLSGDELRDAQQTTFGKPKASFLQTSLGASRESRRERAVARLQRLQRSSMARPELALLVTSLKLDKPFAKVIEAIDDLVAKLKIEQADEVKHYDYCTNELHENQVETERKTAEQATLEAEIDDLTNQHKVLTEDIATLKNEITELHVELQRASENRKSENHDYQQTSMDQKKTAAALKAAYDKLASFYLNLMQGAKDEPQFTVADARPQFGAYERHGDSNRVMGLIQQLIGETQTLIEGTDHDEQNAQKAYEQLISDTNASVKAKTRMIADKTEELAKVDEVKAEKSVERDQVVEALAGLAESKGALLKECTFLLDNFDARQAARAAEIDSLGKVKAILSGMK